MPKPLSPEAALLKLRDSLKKSETTGLPPGPDGLPVHWLVKEFSEGLQFADSAGLLKSVGYSAINMLVRRSRTDGAEPDGAIPVEHLSILFQRFLDWLALNLPQSKTWGVEFLYGCPSIPCDREFVVQPQGPVA
jgi:hypothetical protein